jgi:hypothetical protein
MSLLGQKRTNHRGPKTTFVRFYPKSGQILQRSEMTLCGNSGHGNDPNNRAVKRGSPKTAGVTVFRICNSRQAGHSGERLWR